MNRLEYWLMVGLVWSPLWMGFLAACIALYGRYWDLPAVFTGPKVCKLEGKGCQVLFRSPKAALLGVPNSLLGVLYYPLLGYAWLAGWPFWVLAAATSAAFLMTVVLAVILIKDRLECRVCWVGHLCNTALWLLMLLG